MSPDPSSDSDATSAPRFPDVPTRRCVICLGDEPEAALPDDWATPCICSLEGHQNCLMDLVNDQEAQAKDVQCPICKSPIFVTDRYDAAIQLSSFLNKKFSAWSPKILLLFIASGTIVSSSVYGATAISLFAGPNAALAFLTKPEDTPLFQLLRRPRSDPPIDLVHLSILPLIAPALIVNRINVGDVLTIPISLAYAALFTRWRALYRWPPSPDGVMALYPALKSSYFHIHRVVSRSLESSWAVQARTMAVEQGFRAIDDVAPPPWLAPAMNILDLEIDIRIREMDDDDEDDAMLDNNQAIQQNGAVDATSRSPINFLAGALLWPGVCYGVGELMRHLLPARFVTKPLFGPPIGLLQERWGRSFVGGCLFVVLKDAFFLYVKYKKIMNTPYRRIKNSDRRNIRN